MPHGLQRSALLCILPTAVALGWLAYRLPRQLDLSAVYPAKVLVVFAAAAAVALAGLAQHHPFNSFGPANTVTAARGAGVALLAGLIGERGDSAVALLAVAAGLLVTVLDGADGWLARRTGMTSRFGARFDMETDAALILVLALLVWQFGKAGAWVIASGLMRYAFVAAGRVLPRLRGALPPRTRRKTVAIAQVVTLIVALHPGVAPAVAGPLAAAALGMLALSFLGDVRWLLRPRVQPSGSVVRP